MGISVGRACRCRGGGEGGHGLDQEGHLFGFEFGAVTGLELFDGFVFGGEPVFDGHSVLAVEDVDGEVVAAAGEPEVLWCDAAAEADVVVFVFFALVGSGCPSRRLG